MVQMPSMRILCLSGIYGRILGIYGQLLGLVTLAVLVLSIPAVLGWFILRYKQPASERPYRTFGGPLLAAITYGVRHGG